MTVVEIWDSDPVDNVIGCIALCPDRVVYVGFEMRIMEKRCAALRRLFEMKGMKTKVQCRAVPRDLYGIVGELEKIAGEDEQCAFDALGGEGLILAAMGIACERLGGRASMHSFNVKRGKGYDCISRERIEIQNPASLTIQENAVLYGGSVKHMGYCGAQPEENVSDAYSMWDVCRTDNGDSSEHPCAVWNRFCSVMAAVDTLCTRRDGEAALDLTAEQLDTALRRSGGSQSLDSSVLRRLSGAGLLEFSLSHGLSVRYKNDFIRRCIVKAGNVLEYVTLCAALAAREGDGSTVYGSCAGGVTLGWDGEPDSLDTINEIDVMLMRGMTPVFISCKNGSVDDEELYKLDSVARRFGGKDTHKVLIATYMGDIRKRSDAFERFRRRAADMGIKLIFDVDRMDRAALEKKLAPACLFAPDLPPKETPPIGGIYAGYKWRFV